MDSRGYLPGSGSTERAGQGGGTWASDTSTPFGLSEPPPHPHVAVASGGTVVYTAGPPSVLSLPAASTLLGVGQLGYESHLVEIEAVQVLD